MPNELSRSISIDASNLHELQKNVEERLDCMRNEGFYDQFFHRDAGLWAQNTDEIDEIVHRLDWLDAPREGHTIIDWAETLLKELLAEGFCHTVVLGMGGSSLAPEVYSQVIHNVIFNARPRLDVQVLDTTDPEQIMSICERLDLSKTFFIVSSKSGTTAEVNSLLAYFWKEVEKLRIGHPGKQFMAITDPGTALAKLGIEWGFREVVRANPNVGGRFSALIEFGLIPAVLSGFDGHQLLEKAGSYMINNMSVDELYRNPGMMLGTILAEAYINEKDKLTVMADKSLPSFGAWLEQLVAESSGKSGKGIVPIEGEPLMDFDHYQSDRLFVRISMDSQSNHPVENLIASKHPVVYISIKDIHDLGALFYVWEVAISVACAILGVNAFNQPDVQMSKSITQQLMDVYRSGQGIDEGEIMFSNKNVTLFGRLSINRLREKHLRNIIGSFFEAGKKGDYIAINAFLPKDDYVHENLQRLREKLGQRYSLPTMLGYGPRFLHSTGQLHKGGKNNGFFIILTSEKKKDIDIPNQNISFGKLQLLQAIGDMRALEQMGRRVIRLHLLPNALDAVVSEL